MSFTVVRSSAGSGKTYTLVRKYLSFVLAKKDPSYFSRLLAITFTNKATNEMKSRIIEALEGMSVRQPKYNDLLIDLSDSLSLSEEELVKRAENVLSHLIHSYSDFSISTIDRFVTRIIKSFAFELNIPGAFEIELDQQRILEKSIDLLYDKLPSDSDLERLLVSFADYKFSSDKSFQLDDDLMRMAEEINKSESKHYVEKLLEDKTFEAQHVRKSIFGKVVQIESAIQQKAKNLLSKINSIGLEESELAGGSRGIYSYLNKLSSGVEFKQMSSAGKKIIESGNWKSSKASSNAAALIDAHSEEFTAELKALELLIQSNWSLYNFCKIMTMRIDLMSIVYEIAREINLYKESNNLMQLDDFNERISSLINDSPVPYIYERTGEKYNHYLIDEFQDTSQIQWYNLIPLLEEGLSKGFESLIVGDEKQAIYRFRGGDVHQMGRLPTLHFDGQPEHHYKDREAILKAEFKDENLSFNYRSSKSVVDFVNDFFQLMREKFPSLAGSLYKDHEQKVKKTEVVGSVYLKFLPVETDVDGRLNAMKQEIDDYISMGYSHADIAILCRKTDQCSSVANFLMQHNYPVFSSESLKLSSSPEVIFLINFLRWPNTIDKNEVEFNILNYLIQNQHIAGFDNDAFLDCWSDELGMEKVFHRYMPDLNLTELFSKSILEIASELTRFFLKEDQLNPFVMSLIDQIIKFQEQFGNDVSEFIKWWDDKGVKVDVQMPVQNNSIQVLTIHKAKGLEFNIVLIPFMDELISAGKKSLWVETVGEEKNILPIAWLPANKSLLETNYADEYQEEMNKSFIDTLNVMYVAITRAVHHISIFSTDQKKKENDWREDNLLWNSFSLKEFSGSEEAGEFIRGERKKYLIEKDLIPENAYELKVSNNYDWRRNVELKFRSDEISLTETALNAQEYGNLFHEIMSRIININDLPSVINSLALSTAIEKTELEAMGTSISETLKNELIKEYFEEGTYEVYNEREILSSKKEVLRPDRMMISENNLVIIDYKTGKADQVHEEQISNYINVLKEVGSYKIQAFLIYFSSREVRKIA